MDWMMVPGAFKWLEGGTGSDPAVSQAFALGFQAKQHQQELAIKRAELQMRWRQMDILNQMRLEKMHAEETQQKGMAELGGVMGEIASTGDWTNPELRSKFWTTAGKYPQLMTHPSFKELTQQFELADSAKLRRDLLDSQISGRDDLETTRQQNRLELLTTKMDALADMKVTDENFKTNFENIMQQHRLERDKLKASVSGAERFDLNKSDEIKMRSELNSLQTALNQRVLKLPEFEAKRQAVFDKYKAMARTQSHPTPSPSGKRIRVKAPDGTIGNIPESQLDDAKKNGYSVIE